jgi:hypothetical protein
MEFFRAVMAFDDSALRFTAQNASLQNISHIINDQHDSTYSKPFVP